MTADVVKATAADAKALAQSLALAFQDDPALSWALPDPDRRRRHAPRYFETVLRHVYLPKGEVYTTPDRDAVALWGPPGEWETSPATMVRLVPAMARAAGRRLPTVLRMVNLMEGVHKKRTDPHWYLPFIGARPDRQGRGYGSRLVGAMLGRCDRDGIPAYLEASAPRNRDLYSRLGFMVLEELRWPGGGPPFWPMWREPGGRSPQTPS